MATNLTTEMVGQGDSCADASESKHTDSLGLEAEQTQEKVVVETAIAGAAPLEQDPLDHAPAEDVVATTKSQSGEVPAEDVGTTQATVEKADKQELTFSGFLSYRKASATFPIYHKRFFFFSDEAMPLDRLHAFYDKYHKTNKVDKQELNQLVAHAATSGKGLLFFSKMPDTVPSGILECSRMTEIRPDDVMQDKFLISYGGKQAFSFETGSADREAWIAGIRAKCTETDREVQQIRTSALYASRLKALEEGTAFRKIAVPEGANDVLSEDDTACKTSSILQETPDKQKSSRRTSTFLSGLRDKLPHDNVTSESNIGTDKSSRKDKRKSFLANFLAIREGLVVDEAKSTASAAEGATSHGTEGHELKAASSSTGNDMDQTIAKSSGTGEVLISERKSLDSPRSPIKDKLDGLFNKFFHRKNELSQKDDGVQACAADFETDLKNAPSPTEGAPIESAERSIEAPTGTDGSAVHESAATSAAVVVESFGQHDPAQVTAERTADTPTAEPLAVVKNETERVEKGPLDKEGPAMATGALERKGLTRRLTSMFRTAKKSAKPLVADIPNAKETSESPPQLPETAKVYDVDSDIPESQAALEAHETPSAPLKGSGQIEHSEKVAPRD